MLGPAMPDNVAVLAARGPLAAGEGEARKWFSVDRSDGLPKANLDEAARSRQALIALAESVRTSTKSLIVVGFSQGGIIGLEAFLNRPDLFVGCAVATGRLLEGAEDRYAPAQAHRGKPLYWCHGKNDQIMPISMVEGSHARIRQYGVDLRAITHEGGHEVPSRIADEIRGWITEVLRVRCGGRAAGMTVDW